MDAFENVVYPTAAGSTTCGYCSPPGERSQEESNYHSATLDAVKLTPAAYQEMIDRGWRRSGTYCYKPDLRKSCCPQYTIKLDALEFKPGRSHKKALNRWNRFVLEGSASEEMDVDDATTNQKQKKGKKKPTPNTLSLGESIHSAEAAFLPKDSTPTHNLEIILERASYTEEKFELYKKYQSAVHSDHRNSPSGFKRFLVDSPLTYTPITYTGTRPEHLPTSYGSYHQLYRVDGRLVAVAVLDILPSCVSSVYFMYDDEWGRFSLGKLSALREVTLAKEIHDAGAQNVKYLYLGFYIHSCPKMRYKGDYSPSFLADPETYQWFPLGECAKVLDKYRYASFSNPSNSCNEIPPVVERKVDLSLFEGVQAIARTPQGGLISVPIQRTNYLRYEEVCKELGACINGLGGHLTGSIAFAL